MYDFAAPLADRVAEKDTQGPQKRSGVFWSMAGKAHRGPSSPSGLESFTPVRRDDTLAVRAREQLRSAIMAGRFKPGEKLTLRAVAASLAVSLTPAREALYNLAAEGALEVGPRGSVYVPRLDRAKIAELTKIRVALEGLAAAEAARHLDHDVVAELRDLNDRLVEADGRQDYRDVIRLNWAFHFRIYNLSGMPALTRMIEGCWLKTGSYLNLIYPDFGKTSTGIRNHQEILAAIEARDPNRMLDAVRCDIEYASTAMEEVAEAISVDDPRARRGRA